MYTIERIKEEVEEACTKAHVDLIIPISINGRLTKCLGRVRYIMDKVEGIVPISMEFSKQLIQTASDKSIHDVVLHETAHYITTMRTGEKHGHDKVFKNICKEIGASSDGHAADIERIVPDSQIYKYVIYCPICKKIVGGKYRKCKVIDHIEWYACNTCGEHNLQVIQNW